MLDKSKISIELPAELAALVNDAVASGEYATASDVVREALSGWRDRRKFDRHERDRIVNLWTEGLASGPGRYDDMNAIRAEARRRLMESMPSVKS